MKLNVESINGEPRIFEDSVVDDVYVDSLESGESEYDLDYEYSDEESANDNEITKNEVGWLTKWNKYWKLDENKKEYIKDKKRIPHEYVHYTIEQINKAKKRKDREHNLKKTSCCYIFII
jgi:hypothetical protein